MTGSVAKEELPDSQYFQARRIPDFARLHALEDARVARWKRQNKKTVTVPLGFRLKTDPCKVNAAGAGGQQAATASGATNAREPARGVQPSSKDRGESTSGKERDATAATDDESGQQKENQTLQGRRGAPAEKFLYPSAFSRNVRAGRRDSHASSAGRTSVLHDADRPISSGGALRPLSTRGVSSALAPTYASQQHKDICNDAVHRARDVDHTSTSMPREPLPSSTTSDSSGPPPHGNAPSAPSQPHSGGRAPAPDPRHPHPAARERERGAGVAGRAGAGGRDYNEDQSGRAAARGVGGAGGGGQEGGEGRAARDEDATRHEGARVAGPGSSGSNVSSLSAIVANDGAPMTTDPEQLRRRLEKLPVGGMGGGVGVGGGQGAGEGGGWRVCYKVWGEEYQEGYGVV